MALHITTPAEPIITEIIVVTLFGQPGIGKTSIAFSASKPLLFDFDGGSQRAIGRKDVVRVSSWNDVASVEAQDVAAYDTLIIDTVGRALEFLAANLIAGNPKLARSTGELSMQGYGALKTAFAQWLGRVRTFGKTIILVAHEKEERDGDNTVIRIDAMGATRVEVIRLSDLVGFVSAGPHGGSLDFNPTEKHTGKNCVGFPALNVPDLNAEPSWFAGRVAEALSIMNAKSDAQREREEELEHIRGLIAKLADDAGCNAMIDVVKGDPILKRELHKKATALGLVFDKATGAYIPNESEADDVAA